MATALPRALRERILRAYLAGEETCPAIAERFFVSLATVERLGRRAREGTGLEPLPRSGRPPKIRATEKRWLKRALKKNPYTSSYELAEAYCAAHPERRVHRSTILRVMHELGWTHKKNTHRAATRP